MPSDLTSHDLIEFGAQEQNIGRQVQPEQKYDHRSERPVRRVEVAEILHVEGEGKGRDSTANDSSTPIVSPAVTTTVNDCLIVNIFAQPQNQTLTPPSGWTERFDQGANNAGASDYICALHHMAVSGTGVQPTETPTPSATGFTRGCISFALMP